jgi:hypothetical protein
MSNRWVWVVSLGLLAGAGCGRKSHGGNDADVGDGGGIDGSAGPDGAEGGPSDTGAACNAIVDDTPAVREMSIGGATPVLNGGTIPDGTYVLVERYTYNVSCDCLVHGKIVVGGGGTTIQTLLRTEPQAAERQSGTMSTALNSMNWSFTCPPDTTGQHNYNVITGTSVVALQTFNGNLQYETWLSGSCNTITNDGTPITEMRVAADIPTSTGGTLVDGTYHLTRREIYTGSTGASGPTGDTRKATLVITNATTASLTMDFATSINGAGDSRERYSGNVPASGVPQFAVTRSCPPIAVISVSGFSATGNTLVLVNQNDGEVDTWTRQ